MLNQNTMNSHSTLDLSLNYKSQLNNSTRVCMRETEISLGIPNPDINLYIFITLSICICRKKALIRIQIYQKDDQKYNLHYRNSFVILQKLLLYRVSHYYIPEKILLYHKEQKNWYKPLYDSHSFGCNW